MAVATIISLLVSALPVIAQAQSERYTVMVHNIENLFDADEQALYDEYLPTDRNGNEQYGLTDLHTKLTHLTALFQRVDNGKGPDIAILNELEADLTPSHYTDQTGVQASKFLKWYSGQSLESMLTTPITDSTKTLPAEWWLIKSLSEAGMDDYQMAVGYSPRDAQGHPDNVHKNVVLSRLPILRDKVRVHPLHRARPILEVWLQDGANQMVVLANHWKSRASSAKMEQIRIQNAQVLRKRILEIRSEYPELDIIVGGDLNSNYHQAAVYDMAKTGLNTVMGATNDRERVLARDLNDEEFALYNLWYELPIDERGSDTYRGEWGTLMHVLMDKTMFDNEGFRYVDRSFEVLKIPGWNAYQTSGVPRRWSSHSGGFGFSDHFPLLFEIERNGKESHDWSTPYPDSDQILPVTYNKPDQYYTLDDIRSVANIRTVDRYYDQYFYLPISLNQDNKLIVEGQVYTPYGPGFDAEKVLKQAGSGYFYGRLLKYRGTWEFLIETPDFVLGSGSH